MLRRTNRKSPKCELSGECNTFARMVGYKKSKVGLEFRHYWVINRRRWLLFDSSLRHYVIHDFWWIKSHFNVDMSDTLLETICINGTRPPYKRPAWVIGQVGSEELQNRRAQTATSRERQNHWSHDKRRPKWVTRIHNFCCKLIATTVSAPSLLNSVVYSTGDCVYGVY